MKIQHAHSVFKPSKNEINFKIGDENSIKKVVDSIIECDQTSLESVEKP